MPTMAQREAQARHAERLEAYLRTRDRGAANVAALVAGLARHEGLPATRLYYSRTWHALRTLAKTQPKLLKRAGRGLYEVRT